VLGALSSYALKKKKSSTVHRKHHHTPVQGHGAQRLHVGLVSPLNWQLRIAN
jgi:hypothetical protein